MAEPIAVGRIVGAHGLRGELRVRYTGDGPENWAQLRSVIATREDETEGREYSLREVRSGRQGEVLCSFEGIADRDSALALRGLVLRVDAAALPELEAGEYYHYELIGCRVWGHDGTDIGTVREIWETGAHDVLVVEGEDGQRHLVPAAGDLLQEVDPGAKRIVVELLPGLLDAPAPSR